jgi:uncharacterized tellurite resistance protein B-like protein
MFGLLFFFLLIAGTFLAYRFSSASKVKKRMQEVLSPFEKLDAESRRLRQTLESDIELATSQYIQGVHAARLKAIPLDDVKKHATGIRLQALKDFGIRSVADLQGWNEYRVSQVRGVGPKSASAIVHAVARITTATRVIPIDHPAPPFLGDTARQLIQALYRQHWFDMHIAEQSDAFAKLLDLHQNTRNEVLTKTSFGCWLWKFGSNKTIRQNINRANATVGALEEENSRSMRDKLSTSLTEGRAVCNNRVSVDSMIQDVNENRELYDSWLTSRLGKSVSTVPAKPMSQQAAPNTAVTSDLVHGEFGRVVPGPPELPIGENQTVSPLPETHLRHPEGLVSVSVGSNIAQQLTEFSLPIAQRAARSKEARWLSKGESIQLQGYTLPHGLVYVGKGSHSERHYVLDPSPSAKPESHHSFSYPTLNPEQRSRYLAWLAEGASLSTDAGFGMLYFYGLERRTLDLIQGKVSHPLTQELEHLLEEVHRLGDIFQGKPGSVTQCCIRLSDFAAARACDGTAVPKLPVVWERTYELPFVMRFGLGCFIRDGKPIPVEWALSWSYVEPTVYLRTPATRCPQEFAAAFATLYREKFGEGFIVPINKTTLKVVYQPGWPVHLEREIRHEFSGIPDVAALTGPQQTLKALVEQSTAMIDRYSRYIGRNAAKAGTLEAILNLPLRFWPAAESDRWHAFLTSVVDPMEPITFEAVLRELGYVGDPTIAKIMEIVANLNHALVGFEPDILAGARWPKPSETVVLFSLTSESDPGRSTDEYKKASLTVSLSACVALADGHASEEEALAVETRIASWQHLHADLRTRLRAQYRLQIRQGISLASLKSRFSSLTADGRMRLALALSSLATVDGDIAATEVKLLEQVYRALELEPQLLYSHLYDSTQHAQPLESPALSTTSVIHGYTVDSARLAALRRETEQVSALLAGVFVEEEVPKAAPTQAENLASAVEMLPHEELLPGLDAKHQKFLAELLQKPSWTRSELKAVAAKMQIMLDGALEHINEAAFDLIGEPLAEGDDPVYVQQNILETAE